MGAWTDSPQTPLHRRSSRVAKKVWGKVRWTAVVIAIFTLWIVPQLTRQVQDRAAVRDLKAGLAEEITRSDAELAAIGLSRSYDLVENYGLVLAADIDESRSQKVAKVLGPRRFDTIFQKAQFESALNEYVKNLNRLRTKIEVYFTEDVDLVEAFSAYGEVMQNWYSLSLNTLNTSSWVKNLEPAMTEFNDVTDSWEGHSALKLYPEEKQILTLGQYDDIVKFYEVYKQVAFRIFDAEELIITRLNDGHATGFSTRPCSLVSTLVNAEPGKYC
jgi:hypothetical protein